MYVVRKELADGSAHNSAPYNRRESATNAYVAACLSGEWAQVYLIDREANNGEGDVLLHWSNRRQPVHAL